MKDARIATLFSTRSTEVINEPGTALDFNHGYTFAVNPLSPAIPA